jgi:uncharacterized repeat protein (TIGR03803 family)
MFQRTGSPKPQHQGSQKKEFMTTGQHPRSIPAIHWLEAGGALALVVMFVTAVIGTPTAQAQTYTVLHRFAGADGHNPSEYGHLIEDSAGDLYGTTSGGGASGLGVVFMLNKTGETVLHSFTGGADGRAPYAGLTQDSAGNLYGTTFGGGASGLGVVFKLNKTGETVLYSFTIADGANPYAGLTRDSAGNLYGTTSAGGASNSGVVFKLDTTGTETVLHSFTGGADGAKPSAGMIQDSAGNLYGTTYYGGSGRTSSGNGVVFMLKP